MAGDAEPYVDLVISEHQPRPKFTNTLVTICQPFADNLALLQTLYYLFDLDVAVGQQLDIVGQWIGRTRYLSVPLSDVYFSFDIAGLGFDEGVWKGPDNPSNANLVALPDPAYRLLLKATAAENQWRGTVPEAYAVWDIMFGGSGITLEIHDNQDMTMDIVVNLNGTTPDALTRALIASGYLNLRPAGVEMTITVNP